MLLRERISWRIPTYNLQMLLTSAYPYVRSSLADFLHKYRKPNWSITTVWKENHSSTSFAYAKLSYSYAYISCIPSVKTIHLQYSKKQRNTLIHIEIQHQTPGGVRFTWPTQSPQSQKEFCSWGFQTTPRAFQKLMGLLKSTAPQPGDDMGMCLSKVSEIHINLVNRSLGGGLTNPFETYLDPSPR